MRGPSLDASPTTLGDVAVEADPPLRWALGHTRNELRPRLFRLGLTVHPEDSATHLSAEARLSVEPRPLTDAPLPEGLRAS